MHSYRTEDIDHIGDKSITKKKKKTLHKVSTYHQDNKIDFTLVKLGEYS